MIQGEKTKLNPIPQGGGLKSYFPFQRVLGSVRGYDLVCYVCYSKAKEWNPQSNPPYLTLCRRKRGGGPKIFDSKFFSDSNSFDPQFFWTQNWPKMFLEPYFFLIKLFFELKFFWNQNFFGTKIFFRHKIFLNQNFSKNFSNIFWT